MSNAYPVDDETLREYVADLFEREARHWELEYEALARSGSRAARKVMAAWRLGSSVLQRRAEQYRTGTVRYLVGLEDLPPGTVIGK
jgi:hypothetical protein